MAAQAETTPIAIAINQSVSKKSISKKRIPMSLNNSAHKNSTSQNSPLERKMSASVKALCQLLL
ncbi:hypothetical protein D3C80_1141840 [compost metagenome]